MGSFFFDNDFSYCEANDQGPQENCRGSKDGETDGLVQELIYRLFMILVFSSEPPRIWYGIMFFSQVIKAGQQD
jgi:hypothetical protein